MEVSPTIVSTLVGRRHVALAIQCLGSLWRYSLDPVCFRVHDDGSLEGRDLAELSRALPVERFVLRAEADDRIAAELKQYPNCRALRQVNPLALKLFDVTLLSDGTVAYC